MSAAIQEKKEAYEAAIHEQKRMPAPGEFPAETQERKEGVGLQHEMKAQPISSEIVKESELIENMPVLAPYKASGKLQGRRALITGGDSGIGRAIALFFAKEGADVAIGYLPVEQQDAEDTCNLIDKEVGLRSKEKEGKKKGKRETEECLRKEGEGALCELIPIDIQTEENCKKLVEMTVKKLGGIDLLINNASYQMTCENVEEMKAEQVEKTFRTNVFAPIYLIKHAVPHMKEGSSIIFSTSVVAYQGTSNHFFVITSSCFDRKCTPRRLHCY